MDARLLQADSGGDGGGAVTFTAGSLFSGIGGIDVAFAAAGFDIRFQVEIDDYCRKVLSKHAPRYWPNAVQHVDIRDVGRAELGSVDVLAGGFPCQDISFAGKGAGLDGARSVLWFEFRRIIGEVRPRFVFVENVPAITGRGGTTVLAHLTALGYDARWGTVGAADAGAPHRRERWFCVAYAEHDGHTSATLRGCDAAPVLNSTSRQNRASELARGDTPRTVSVGTLVNATSAVLEGQSRRQPSCAEPARSGDGASQSELGRNNDGLFGWLDRPRFPARRGQPQHEWEPARQIAVKGSNWASRIHALGNAVVPQVVYPFAVEIMRQLAEAESHGD